jgi:hypothetical protein
MWFKYTSLGVLIAIPLIVFLSPPAEATEFNKFISISRSKSCEISSCVLVKDLIKYDTSNKKISGDFKFDIKTGDYARQKGIKNHANWYFGQSKSDVVFVEPDSSILIRSKNIEIVPSLGEFAPQGNLTKSPHSFGKSKTITFKSVYVDERCEVARVGVKDNVDLAKVIAHLKSECTTDLGNKLINIFNQTKLNYCGNECQHQKFIKEVKILAKQKLIIAGKK